jgi:CubicO group peptidase (beta-lactamase class C family)
VFAYAALKLCDEGLLDLDTPLCQHFPHLYLPDEPYIKLVNMRHVLSHTAGFPNWREKRKALTILSQPGEKFSYSGEGYVYLQKVVEYLSGQKLQDFMKSNLFTPFGMDNTFYLKTCKDDDTGVAAHDVEGELLTQYIRLNNAAGPLYTIPSDFAKFIIEIMQRSKSDSHHLTEELLKEMLQPQIKINESLSWGLGWGIQHSRYGDSFFQHGKSSGFQAFSVFYLEEKIGVVIMTNSGNGLKICEEIMIQSIGGEHPSFSGFL